MKIHNLSKQTFLFFIFCFSLIFQTRPLFSQPRLIKRTTQNWDGDFAKWQNRTEYIYQYDDNGNLLTELRRARNPENSKMVNSFLEVNEYDISNNHTSRVHYGVNISEFQKINTWSAIYDEQNRLIETKRVYYFNEEISNVFENVFIYNEDDCGKVDTIKFIDNSIPPSDAFTTFKYDDNCLKTEQINFSNFSKTDRITWVYDENQNILNEKKEVRKNENNPWELNYEKQTEYDENQNIISYFHHQMTNLGFHESITEINYDDLNRKISERYWRKETDSLTFELYSFDTIVYTLNEEGLVNRKESFLENYRFNDFQQQIEDFEYYCDGTLKIWRYENLSIGQNGRTIYEYDQFFDCKKADDSFEIMLRPNPASTILCFDFPPPNESEFTIQIFSADGKLHLQKTMDFYWDTLDLDIYQLIPGNYFLQIEKDGKQSVKQFSVIK